MDSDRDRLVFLFDLFKIICSKHEVSDNQIDLLHSYVIGLAFSPTMASKVILKSIETFEGEKKLTIILGLLRKSFNSVFLDV